VCSSRDAQGSQQKWDGQTGRVYRQHEDAARNGLARRGHGQYTSQDWADAGRPAKRKRKSKRVSSGPARKINDTEMNCAGPNNRGAFSPKRIQIAKPPIASSAPTTRPERTGIRPSRPIKWRPKRTIIAPAKGARRFLFCNRNCPTALADAPKITNTTEKPMTNANEDAGRLPRDFSPRPQVLNPDPREHRHATRYQGQYARRQKRN